LAVGSGFERFPRCFAGFAKLLASVNPVNAALCKKTFHAVVGCSLVFVSGHDLFLVAVLHRAAPWHEVYQENPHFLALPKNKIKKNPIGVSDGVKALLLSHGHHEETGASLSGLRGRWWVICWG
jgi:hypothetical protein